MQNKIELVSSQDPDLVNIPRMNAFSHGSFDFLPSKLAPGQDSAFMEYGCIFLGSSLEQTKCIFSVANDQS